MMAGWSTDLTRALLELCGGVATWKSTCMREFVSHNAEWTQSMYIGFTLNSHWAIQLLNWFESGFSVDRPQPFNYE